MGMSEVAHKGAKVYTYTRASTSMQVDGYSLDAQRKSIMKYVEYQDMKVVGEYEDAGKSGKNIIEREGFMISSPARTRSPLSLYSSFPDSVEIPPIFYPP